MPQALNFDAWLLQVKQILRIEFEWSPKSAESLDAEAWRVYYNDGYSPRGAVYEDFRHA